MKVITNKVKIKEILSRGVETVLPSVESLEKKLLLGKKIRLYCGYDPTAPTLHLGNAVTLIKLSQFQSLGHEVIFLIGDFTGMIGDPTEKMSARKKLSRKQVLFNAKNYKRIASKFLNFSGPNPAKIKFNSKWNDKLSFRNLIELSSNFTVQQMITRDMFQERIKGKKPIYLHEFLYPLTQAYDSVVLDVDLEIGGRDQLFNMLCGRDLMKTLKNKEKFILATKLLTDSGGKKMGKSEGNMVSLEELPEKMYGAIMAWPDGVITLGFDLFTNLSKEEINEILKLGPRESKARLSKEIVSMCHDKKSGIKAEEEFNRVFRDKEKPINIPEVSINEKEINILDLLINTGLSESKSEAKRLVEQGGVKIDGQIHKDWKSIIRIKKGEIIQVGKRKFVKIV